MDHLLHYEGEWSLDREELDAKEDRYICRKLMFVGAVKVVNRRTDEYNKYRWKEGVRERLIEYLESLETLPCGHRLHIKHTENGYDCKYCDEDRSYAEKTIKRLYE